MASGDDEAASKAGHMAAPTTKCSAQIPLPTEGRSLIALHSSNPFSSLARPGVMVLSAVDRSPQHLVRSRGAARSTTGFPDGSASPRPSCAVTYILAPLGKHSVRLAAEQESEDRRLVRQPRRHPSSGTARLSATRCEGSRRAYAPRPRALCHYQPVSRWPRPSL